jgi:hypothetical protein
MPICIRGEKKFTNFKLKFFSKKTIFYRSSFTDFCSRYSRDERYRGIDKMRERENLFNDYLSDLRRREKDEKHQKKEQVRRNFQVDDFAINCTHLMIFVQKVSHFT